MVSKEFRIPALLGGLLILGGCSASPGAREVRTPAIGTADLAIETYRLRMDGKIDEAKRALEQGLARDPENAASWLELARLELQRGVAARELDTAQKAIERAVQSAPADPVCHRWAARIALLDGLLKSGSRPEVAAQFRKAIAAGERAVALDPDDHEARKLLVSLYGNNPADLGGDQDRARLHVEALEERSPVDGVEARCEFSLKHEPEKKLQLWLDLAGKLGQDARVQGSLAREYAWGGNVEKAAFHADQALALDPTRIQVLLDLARAFALEKNFAPAEQFARRYLALDPPPPPALRAWAHMALGQMERLKGDAEASTASFELARKIDPYCWFTMAPPPEALFQAPRGGSASE